MRIGGIARNAKSLERAHRIESVKGLREKDQVRMERRNLFEVGVDGAAYLALFLRVGRIVAVDGIADKAVLDSKGIQRLGETRAVRPTSSTTS